MHNEVLNPFDATPGGPPYINVLNPFGATPGGPPRTDNNAF